MDPDDVVSPPYDVAGVLPNGPGSPRGAPTTPSTSSSPVRDQLNGLDQYQNAARTFRSWLEAGILRRDGFAAFYLYRMTFHDERVAHGVMTGSRAWSVSIFTARDRYFPMSRQSHTVLTGSRC